MTADDPDAGCTAQFHFCFPFLDHPPATAAQQSNGKETQTKFAVFWHIKIEKFEAWPRKQKQTHGRKVFQHALLEES